MSWDLILGIAVIALLTVGEFIVWDLEALWHKSEPKPDPRNWKPPH